MRLSLPIALAAIPLPTPSLATIGLACDPVSGEGPTVSIVFGAYGRRWQVRCIQD